MRVSSIFTIFVPKKIPPTMRVKLIQQTKLFEVYASIEEQVPDDARMKLVNALIDKMSLSSVYATYKAGGCPPYDPRCLLKAIIFAFINNTYSSRKIAKQMMYDARYKWLAGGYKPSYRTILRFLSEHMADNLQRVFANIVEILIDKGYIDIATVFVDGTTIESRASRYSIVWRKTVVRNSKNNTEKVKALINQIFENVSEEIVGIETDNIGEMLSDSDISICVQALDELQQKGVRKKGMAELGHRLDKASEYNEALDDLGDRNSMTKNDKDAIGMRPKDDVMKIGPNLAMHNLQIATNNQFLLGFGLYSHADDMSTFPSFLDLLRRGYDPDHGASYPCFDAIKRIIGDAGYGYLDNVEACKGIIPYLKYPGYECKNPFHIYNMPYDPQEDTYTCPNGKKLTFISQKKGMGRKGEKNKERTIATYRCESCEGCPLRKDCFKKTDSNREPEITVEWREARQELKALLDSPQGQELLKRRSREPEAVFGIQKWDHLYRRFRHFSKKGMITDLLLLFIAHNIDKAYSMGLSPDCVQTGGNNHPNGGGDGTDSGGGGKTESICGFVRPLQSKLGFIRARMAA